MRFEFIYTPYPNIRDALRDLEEKLKKIDFEPNLGIFFLVGDLINHYKEFSKLLRCKTICMPIEGYITPKAVWMRGALLLLLDAKCDVYCFKGSTKRVCKGLRDLKTYNFYLLIYPVFYFSGRLQALNALIREKIYYRSYRKGNEIALKKFSDLLEDKIVYPMNKILRPIRDKGANAIAFNIFPLKFKYGYPIALNGENIGRGLIAVCFKEKVKSYYEDTLPERGKSFEETIEILKNELGISKIVEVNKRGVAVGHVNGLKAVEFVLKERGITALKRDVKEDLDRDRFMPATPYCLVFISNETFGASLLGILEYPVGIYPCLYDLDVFSPYASFTAHETVKGGTKELERFFDKDYNLFVIDQYYILMYRENIVEFRKFIGNNYGIFTTHPSYTSQSLHHRFMTEVEDKICINVTRTISFMKFQ